jgi:hypothetical protein
MDRLLAILPPPNRREGDMIRKRVLVRDRVRRPPPEGFSWVDRRFVREYAPGLSRAAILYYFFLSAVSDKDGLSYWGERSTAARLRLEVADVEVSRDELVRADLIAFRAPLTQVLALPEPALRSAGEDISSVGAVLRRLAEASPQGGKGGRGR